MKNINQFKSAFDKKIKDNSFRKTDIVNIFCGKLNQPKTNEKQKGECKQ